MQKGNPVEERKIQRLFRRPEISKLIKRCNDFGAGGVSVAIGELADGLHIYLDRVPKKYEGLSATELAISESQERMAVVLAPESLEQFIAAADSENLEATVVAYVTEDPRLVMEYQGTTIVNLSRAFLDSAGDSKKITVDVAPFPAAAAKEATEEFDTAAALKELVGDLNICSKRGMVEYFDSSIGAGSVLMPFGGKTQLTPTQAMAAKIPVLNGQSYTDILICLRLRPIPVRTEPALGCNVRSYRIFGKNRGSWRINRRLRPDLPGILPKSARRQQTLGHAGICFAGCLQSPDGLRRWCYWWERLHVRFLYGFGHPSNTGILCSWHCGF